MSAADRVLEIVEANRSNGLRLVDDAIVTGEGTCLPLVAAIAAEEASPVDVEAGTGWLFGDGVEWTR